MILADISQHLHLDPNFKAPPPDPELLQKCHFVLIRHAVTEYNTEYSKIIEEHGMISNELKEFNCEWRMIDKGIREEGVG